MPLTDFTTVTGETVQKEFVTKSEKFRYYADDDCQLVVLPLQGGVNMALILGDGTGLSQKLSDATTRKVWVTLPKFEVETSLDDKELVRYLAASGCGQMFVDGGAESIVQGEVVIRPFETSAYSYRETCLSEYSSRIGIWTTCH